MTMVEEIRCGELYEWGEHDGLLCVVSVNVADANVTYVALGGLLSGVLMTTSIRIERSIALIEQGWWKRIA